MRLMSAPAYVNWNYTYTCNFNCSHCYSRADSYPAELSTEDYARFVDDFAAAGVFRVGLGGGEPLMRPDCYEMVQRLSDHGIAPNITTNGWFIDAAAARRLRRSGLEFLYVSIDSPFRTVHDRFRRKNGSFDRAVEAVRYAVDAGLHVILSTVVTRANRFDLGQLVDFAQSHGAAGVQLKRFRPSGNGARHESEHSLEDGVDEILRQEALEIRSRTRIDVTFLNGPDESVSAIPMEGCPCGHRSICVRPNGDVSPCSYSDIVLGNLTSSTLRELWLYSEPLELFRKGGACVGAATDRGRPLVQLALNAQT